jgi:hypothetical protein
MRNRAVNRHAKLYKGWLTCLMPHSVPQGASTDAARVTQETEWAEKLMAAMHAMAPTNDQGPASFPFAPPQGFG